MGSYLKHRKSWLIFNIVMGVHLEDNVGGFSLPSWLEQNICREKVTNENSWGHSRVLEVNLFLERIPTRYHQPTGNSTYLKRPKVYYDKNPAQKLRAHMGHQPCLVIVPMFSWRYNHLCVYWYVLAYTQIKNIYAGNDLHARSSCLLNKFEKLNNVVKNAVILNYAISRVQ